LQDGQATRLGGLISKLQPKLTKQGKPMSILTIEDLDGSVEVLAFPETHAKCAIHLKADAPVFVTGVVNLREDKPKIFADQIIPLTDVPKRFTKAMHIRLPTTTASEGMLLRIQDLLEKHAGGVPVMFCFMYPDGKLVFLETHECFSVAPSTELVDALEELIGEDAVWLKVDTEKLAAKPSGSRQNWGGGDWRKTNGDGKAIQWDSNRPEKA
jgi:DNA polymerase-3 subunit alpha